VVYIVLLLSML